MKMKIKIAIEVSAPDGATHMGHYTTSGGEDVFETNVTFFKLKDINGPHLFIWSKNDWKLYSHCHPNECILKIGESTNEVS